MDWFTEWIETPRWWIYGTAFLTGLKVGDWVVWFILKIWK